MDIFDERNKLTGKFWKKENIGDSIQGTYVGKRRGMNKLSGKEQNFYDLKTEEGETWIVAGNVGIDMQMENVRIGQIVGFKFVETRKAKTPGMNDTKIVQVYADPKIVDKEFLDAIRMTQEVKVKEEFDTSVDEDAEGNTEDDDIDIDSLKEHPFLTPEEKEKLMETIADMSDKKLGTKGDVDEIKEKVMEATNLAFVESNLAKIASTLKEMPDRK